MLTSFTISHIHESSVVAESNTEYIRVSVPQKCTLISHSPSTGVFLASNIVRYGSLLSPSAFSTNFSLFVQSSQLNH